MKKLFSILLLSCICCLVFTACDLWESEPEHTHNYRTEWSYDDTFHWHDCEDENCFEISEESEHTFEDGICSVCGVEQYTEQEHTHVYATEWSHDYSKHWHACTYENCYYVSEIAEHTFENGFCTVCGQAYISMNLNYVIWNDECYVKGIGSCTNSNVVIPSEFNGYPVTEIEISDCDTMTSITLPSSTLYFNLSGCTELTHVTFADGIQSIFGKLNGCTKLTSVTIPDSVTSIRDHTFSFCTALENVTIPDSVTSIEEYAFGCCDSLTRISLSGNITSLGKGAFYDCDGLKEVVIGKGITTLGESAFARCTALTDVTLPDGMTSIGATAFSGCTSLSNITLPDSVTSIYRGAFSGCTSLSHITIPDGMTSIGATAFAGCTSLSNITIPDSVTSIDWCAFSGCNNLTSIVIPDNVTSFGSYAFEYCDSLTHATILCDVIPEWAFVGCMNLTSITFGADVQSIGDNAFHTCKSLSDVYVTSAEAWLKIRFSENGWPPFDYYNTLHIVDDDGNEVTEIEIPNTITEINEYAFYNCKNLESVTIPNSVTEIGDYAFEGCSNLTSITIPDSVTSIGDYAFCWCSSLTSVRLGNGVTSIGSHAFYWCRNLTSVTIPDGVTSIGDYAFYWCRNLTSVTIPDGVTSIGDYAFYWCRNLTSVTIGNGVTSIGEDAFDCCYNLVEVINKSSLNIKKGNYDNGYVGYYALNVKTGGESEIVNKDGYLFYTYDNANYLLGYVGRKTELVLPDNYKGKNYEIYQYAFYECDNLTSVTIPDSVTKIGSHAFFCCYNLVEVINKSSLSIEKGFSIYGYVGYYALNVKKSGQSDIVNKDGYLFYTYDNVNYLLGYVGRKTELVLPDNYKGKNYEIYQYAFYECSNLISVTIPDSVTSIGSHAFYNCSSLTSVTISDSVTNIGDGAFSGCSSLKIVYYTGTIDQWVQISFSSDYSNPLYYAKNLYIDNKLVTEANITTATEINAYAFYNCSSLTSVTIPDGVTSIGDYAFFGCNSLTSIIIPNSVTNIGDGAFSGCSSLKIVYYTGTIDQLSKISIDGYNPNLTKETIYYYSESRPTDGGNYWHYDTDGVTPVKWDIE